MFIFFLLNKDIYKKLACIFPSFSAIGNQYYDNIDELSRRISSRVICNSLKLPFERLSSIRTSSFDQKPFSSDTDVRNMHAGILWLVKETSTKRGTNSGEMRRKR